MDIIVDWKYLSIAMALLSLMIILYRRLKKSIEARFDRIEKTIDETKGLVIDEFGEVRERLSFVEAATIYTMPLESSQPNARSAAAREMWKRRKMKKVEGKSK